jgi:ATP synthase F1 gamma subunit
MAANLRNIKRRIKSVSGIKQITRAMEMVSATKLKKALDRVEHARPYFAQMDEIISKLMASMEPVSEDRILHPLMAPGSEHGHTILVAISADKGLCSSFNTNIIRETNKFINSALAEPPVFRFNPSNGEIEAKVTDPQNETDVFRGTVDSKGIVKTAIDVLMDTPGVYRIEYTYRPPEGSPSSGILHFNIHMITTRIAPKYYWAPQENLYIPFSGQLKISNVLSNLNIINKKVIIFSIGKRVYLHLSKMNNPRLLLLEPEINFNQALPMAELDRITKQLTSLFTSGVASSIHLLYTKYINAARQKPALEQFLPLGHSQDSGKSSDDQDHNQLKPVRDYIFEPSAEELFKSLIPSYARIKVFQALAHSFTSEHSTRMTAMRNATDNAAELIDTLTLKRNKARQAAITKELSEIVGGAEALKG